MSLAVKCNLLHSLASLISISTKLGEWYVVFPYNSHSKLSPKDIEKEG